MQKLEEVWEVVGELCWNRAHGGGYSFTRSDVLAMEWDEAQYHRERAEERRKEEADAVRKARSGAK